MYTKNGQEVEVLHEIAGVGFLVAPILDLQDGYPIQGPPIQGPPMMVDVVYEQAPTARFDAKVIRLGVEIEELRQQKLALRRELREAERRAEERKAKFERLEALQGLEDFIDGKVTHYVVERRWGMPSVVTFASTKCDYGKRDKKLLTLFGDSEGNLAWRLNAYSDGSGSYSDVIPCLSHEEAVEKVTTALYARMVEVATRSLAEHAVEQGVPLPEGYMERVEKAERKDAEGKIAKLHQEIEALKASMIEEE